MNCPYCKQNFTPDWNGRPAPFTIEYSLHRQICNSNGDELGCMTAMTQCSNPSCMGFIAYVEYGYWLSEEHKGEARKDRVSQRVDRRLLSRPGLSDPPFYVLNEVRMWPPGDPDITYPEGASDCAKTLCEEAHKLIHSVPIYAGLAIRKLIEVVLLEYGYSGKRLLDQIECARKDDTCLPNSTWNDLLDGLKDIAEAGNSSAHDTVPYGDKELYEYHLERVYCFMESVYRSKESARKSHQLANDRRSNRKSNEGPAS